MSRMSARQFAAVALCAGFGPALIAGGNLSWTGALLGAAGAALLWCWLLARSGGGLAELLDALPGGKALLWLYLLWSAFLLGWLIRLCEASFPGVTVFPIIPAVLLALAWWASWGGAARLGRVCGILAGALLALFAVPLVAGGLAAHWRIEPPARGDVWRGAGLMLCPMMALFLTPAARTRPKAWWTLLLGAGLALCAGVCRGVLGAGSRACTTALYEVAKTISIGGVMERFEALVSVSLAMSLFAGMALVFAGMDKIQEKVLKTPHWPVRLTAAVLSAGVWWLPDRVSGGIAQLGCLVFGGLLPIVAIFGQRAGKMKKTS